MSEEPSPIYLLLPVFLSDAKVKTELEEWWIRTPRDGLDGGVDFETYAAIYEKMYFHLVPPSQWIGQIEDTIQIEWNIDRKDMKLGIDRPSLSKELFTESIARILTTLSKVTTAAEFLNFLTTATKEVLQSLYPKKADEVPFLPPITGASKVDDEKWKNIAGMLQRIEKRQYKLKQPKKEPKKFVKKAEPIFFCPPTTPLCPHNSWCPQYHEPEHACKFSHYCRLYPCGLMQDEDHMANYHHTPLNHAKIARPPTAELMQFGFEEKKTPRDVLMKKVKQTQRFLRRKYVTM